VEQEGVRLVQDEVDLPVRPERAGGGLAQGVERVGGSPGKGVPPSNGTPT
jgi:hypothetical protein